MAETVRYLLLFLIATGLLVVAGWAQGAESRMTKRNSLSSDIGRWSI
jgi:hypothetical protein